MDGRLVGREAELGTIRGFVAEPERQLRILLLEGEPGIGKTTLWDAGVAEARAAGITVLLSRPAENERSLPYAALGDLVEPVLAGYRTALARPQRRALDAALQRAAVDTPAEHLAVARATLALLRAVAEDRPVLVAIDDVQWLDPPSERALEFAARRLRETRAKLLATRRGVGSQAPPLDLDWAARSGALSVLVVGPLGTSALHELLRAQLGLQLARPRLLRLERITEGNPYFALEIARTLADDRELTVPPSLGDALAERIGALPPETRSVLLLAAASVQPTADLVERAAGTREGLARARALGLLEVHGGRLRFRHPLLSSVTYEQALPGERREAHRRLAQVAGEPDERALQLARGLEAPDEAAAAELEEAAERSAVRGGREAAAELAEAAARLTPAGGDSDRRRRLALAAEHHVAAGDPGRAREILHGLIEGLSPGPERAAFLWRLADTIGDSTEEPIRLCRRALEEAGDDPALCAEIHTALGLFTWIAGELEAATEHCLSAVRFAEEAGDEARLAIAIGEACHAQVVLGVPWDRAAMERALGLERRVGELPLNLRPSFQLAVISLYTDDLETARRLLAAELRRVRRRSDEPGMFHVLFRTAELELRAGNWSHALQAAREAVSLTRQAGIEQEQAATEMLLALVLAHVGELDEARELAGGAHRAASAGGDRAIAIRCAGVLGFVELSAGRPEAALAWLTPARLELERMGTGELSISGVVQNEIDALVAVGRLGEAETVIALVEERGARSGRPWHRAVAARGRALVASAGADQERARAALEEALAAHATLPQPFELARTLLVAGALERRAKHWAAARERFNAALELLDDLGAARWAEHAASELARLPGRRPRSGELTETERRVAALAARGLANKEIAARLFVSVRTVETNLSRAYAKLGVRSRTELARRLPD